VQLLLSSHSIVAPGKVSLFGLLQLKSPWLTQ
jgi:hypothetical protein